MDLKTQSETYREQLLRMTRALAQAESGAIAGDLSIDSQPKGVKLFVDGNLDKRFEKLRDGLEFVAPAFRQWEEMIVTYIRAIPLAAYDTGASDSERLLVWLETTRRLTPRQRDYIACQRARHAVEEAARMNRLAYVRFQERWSVTARHLSELPDGVSLLYLNPIRIWTTFQTRALLDRDAEVPTRIVFFPVAGEIRTAALDSQGESLLHELAELEPVSLSSWAAVTPHADADTLLDTVRDLAAMGLVAL